MKQRLSMCVTLLLTVILSVCFIHTAAMAEETLSIVSNGGIIQKAAREYWYKPFMEKTGVRIIEDDWSQQYAKLRTQVETGQLKWDVVEINYNNLTEASEEGYLEKIDWSKHLDVKDFEASGGVTDYGVPYFMVAGGIGYDGDRLKDGPKTWADFWNVKKWPGKRGVLYRPTVVELALMADGVHPKKILDTLIAPGGIDRAFKKLDELKGHIHWWKSGTESMQILAKGDVVMTYAWNGRIANANAKDGRNFKISYEGGFIGGNQYQAVMKGTKKKALAIEFIKFACSPKPLAGVASVLRYGPANSKSYEYLDAKLLTTMPNKYMHLGSIQGSPDAEKYNEFWLANRDAITQRLAKWAAQ